jgi:hypothetical protein
MSNPNEIKNELLERLKNLSETVTDSFGELAKGNNIFVEQQIQQTRMSTCQSCEDFNAKTTQCKKCGCFMSAKTRLKTASCPVGKWGKVS